MAFRLWHSGRGGEDEKEGKKRDSRLTVKSCCRLSLHTAQNVLGWSLSSAIAHMDARPRMTKPGRPASLKVSVYLDICQVTAAEARGPWLAVYPLVIHLLCTVLCMAMSCQVEWTRWCRGKGGKWVSRRCRY